MEILIGLTAAILAYVVYALVVSAWEGVRVPIDSARLPPAPPHPPNTAEVAHLRAAAAPANQPVAEVRRPTQLRNPKTGETAAVPNNYRFAKKWVKEAMVEEGLLDRVYRNADFGDPGIDTQVRDALQQFIRLPRYHL